MAVEKRNKIAHSIRNILSKKGKPKNRNFNDRIKSAILKLTLEHAILGSAALFWRNWSHARHSSSSPVQRPPWVGGLRPTSSGKNQIQVNLLQLSRWGSGAFFCRGRGQGQVQDHGATWHMGGSVLPDDMQEFTWYIVMQGVDGGK